MDRIKAIVRVGLWVTFIGTVLFLIFPGWKFSAGVLLGGIVGLADFMMIVSTMRLLKPASEDSSLMAKFALMFVGKTTLLLILLAAIIFIFRVLNAKLTLLGFLAGLIIIPLSVVITTFRKK